ncbi:hypothetical protein OHT57_12710 [Streptomyces sp. NBC_00285]|uniref:hypothetical protein n=1 Tax=Streptomyces sp. NBC_00285 TaxID=2975700 RepID=UPI002E2ADD84|nr:hypothetical protein [Streptomyces sp. NBC_00285]
MVDRSLSGSFTDRQRRPRQPRRPAGRRRRRTPHERLQQVQGSGEFSAQRSRDDDRIPQPGRLHSVTTKPRHPLSPCSPTSRRPAIRPADLSATPGVDGGPKLKKQADSTTKAVNASSAGVSPNRSACGISIPAFAAVTKATAA